jgi:hypothetical protein
VPQTARPDSGTGHALPAGGDERPQLPRRQAQKHLSPELAHPPAVQPADQEAEHNPGLMAAFQKGMRSAQENDGAADGLDAGK